MAEAKTKQTGASVEGFLDAITNEQVRADSRAIAAIMQKAAQAEPEMWGSGIVGFGRRTQRYASGKEAQWMLIAFAPRKQNITLYLSPDFRSAMNCWRSSGHIRVVRGVCISSGCRMYTCRRLRSW